MNTLRDIERMLMCVDSLKVYSSPEPDGCEKYFIEATHLDDEPKFYIGDSMDEVLTKLQQHLDK